ncbi:sugar phosphate isomerase/epimerase family protein [Bacillus sp. B15-48]|uniref:sugar phosphate isomerase/epimerase family protein n=1 Tax=Bacillus sp. B15-48 TaxID=1548601 RepID=UPI00193F79A4|nr:sugar phosphate isomerase/epimerase family protein [Bacillus sp. B15-48]MBM4761131.1 TIM barrel protein [Bacillus sp. B15-48]
MKFAQSSAVYFNYSLQYAIRDLHELGYQGIEIWGGRPHMFMHDFDEQMDELVSLLKELDMKVCNFIPAQFRYPSILCSENEMVRKQSVEYIQIAIDNAIKVGSPSVSLCPGMVLFDQDKNKGWDQLVKSLKEIDEYADGKEIQLLIEPAHQFETNLILTVEDGMRMLDVLQSDRFGILLDSGHAHLNGEDFNEIMKLCKGVPLHIHIDDNFGDFDAHLIPGKGNVNLAALFEALYEDNYDGFVSAELGPGYIMAPTSACKETLDYLKSMSKK